MAENRSITVSRRLGAALVVLALVAAACSNSGDDGGDAAGTTPPADAGDPGSGDGEFVPLSGVPGVTDDEIRFAAFGTQANNPLGTCVLDCYVQGIEAYFAFRNSEGGVHGREMVLSTVLDDELVNNQVRALEIVSADDAFGAFSATQVASGWADVADAGIPLWTWSIHFNEMNGQESIFGYSGVVCGTCTSRSFVYAAYLAEATRIASLGYGVSENSKDCAAANARSVERFADETGQEVAYVNDELEFGLASGVAPQVTAMREAGVDFVMACIDLNGMKTFAQEMARQGMGDVKMLHPNTYDHAFVAEAGDLFEGDFVTVGFRPFEADPGESLLGAYLEWMENTGNEPTELAMIGWINADLAYQGILAAGPEFDRQKVIDETNQMTAYTAGGLIPAIDWSRQHEPPTEDDPVTHGYAQQCAAYVRVVDGEFEIVGDATEPWHCWDPTDPMVTEPEPTNFE